MNLELIDCTMAVSRVRRSFRDLEEEHYAAVKNGTQSPTDLQNLVEAWRGIQRLHRLTPTPFSWSCRRCGWRRCKGGIESDSAEKCALMMCVYSRKCSSSCIPSCSSTCKLPLVIRLSRVLLSVYIPLRFVERPPNQKSNFAET